MPELPEVETVVRTLRPLLLGRRITRVQLTRHDIVSPIGFDLTRSLRGRTVKAISRRGKRIILILDDSNCFYIHLGMSGRLTVQPVHSPVASHTHLRANLAGGGQLRFRDPRRFGGIWWIGDACADSGLGPEPLTLRWAQLASRLSRTKRAIKNALMDQQLIAGLGNIYVDEALFEAQIHPLHRADQLAEKSERLLVRAIKTTLRRALRHRGSTLRDYVDASGSGGRFQRLHRVYDRAAEPCARCGTAIERIIVGGRSTHFCPTCQKI